MTVIKGEGKNPTGIVHYYKCNVCGHEDRWTDNHCYVERPVTMWEERFIICSDKCKENMKDIYIKWLGSKKGWTRISAMQNFMETLTSV